MSNVTIDQTRVAPQDMLLNAENPHERQMLIAERTFHLQQREANVYAQSDVVPERFKGKVANCIIAQEMANRLGVGVIEIMQNLYVVYGQPAFSSKYKIARVNNSGKIKGELKYKFFGKEGTDDWGCYAYATSIETQEEIPGPKITIKLAKDEGWYERKGNKWKTMPEKMLMYRAGSWFADVNMPETTFGFPSVDDVRDAGPKEERDITSLSETNINETFKPRYLVKSDDTFSPDNEETEKPEHTVQDEEVESQVAAAGDGEQDSPAYIMLKNHLLKSKTVDDALALRNAQSLGRCKRDEVKAFGEMVDNRIAALQEGMAPK